MGDAGFTVKFEARVPPATADAIGQDFKNAMARLAGGVGVAACWNGEVPTGLLVSSIAALSADPPRLLFCVQKTARAHDALFHARDCSLNILAEGDRDEAEAFSSTDRTPERFNPETWRLDGASPPRHRSPLVCIVGAIGHRMDAGTHSVFVLNVREAAAREAPPLVYFDRRYASLRPLADG
jgi:flavin reductase